MKLNLVNLRLWFSVSTSQLRIDIFGIVKLTSEQPLETQTFEED